MDADDARTPAQKAQTDAAVQRDMKAASAMEKARLAPAPALGNRTGKVAVKAEQKPHGKKKSSQARSTKESKGAKGPDVFTAVVPGSRKKAPAP